MGKVLLSGAVKKIEVALAQLVKALAISPDPLNSIPNTHEVGEGS